MNHQKIKAWLGAAAWLVVTAAGLGLLFARRFGVDWVTNLENKVFYLILGATAALELACFWFAYRNLALDRGYPTGLWWFGVLGPVIQLVFWIVLQTLPDQSSRHDEWEESEVRPKSDSGHGHPRSPRRRAVRWVLSGMPAIALAIGLALWKGKMFEHPETQFIAAILVFMFGYAFVLRGCWWLMHAKGWDNAIVVIAVLPLAVFFIHGRRLLQPALSDFLPLAMVLSPLILMFITLFLPTRKDSPRTKRRSRAGDLAEK